MKRTLLAIGLAASTAACATTSPDAPFHDAQKMVEERTGQHILWEEARADTKAVADRVAALSKLPIGRDAAITIALLENRRLRATYEELGIAQADLVQAGLLANPTVSATIGFPIEGSVRTGVSASVTEELMSVFTIAAKKRIAEAEVRAATARVASAVMDLVRDVEVAYYTLLAATQSLAMQKVVREAAEAALDLRVRQYEAGNTTELDLAAERALYEQSTLDVMKAEGAVDAARATLVKLMGVRDSRALTFPDKLAELPPRTDDASAESGALDRRLDLRAAREEVAALDEALAMARTWRWVGSSSIGGAYDRAPEGYSTLGPGAALELPIFDQKQAIVARRESDLRAAKARVEALEVDILTDVRLATQKVALHRALVERYAETIVPARRKVVRLSEERHAAMLIGTYQLLAAKKEEVAAFEALIDALRDYWIARAELTRASGGKTP